MSTHEREITSPVDLCTPDGRLNPEAVGWSRTPVHHCAMPGWGRRKKWEYWCVSTPTHLVALTVADIDYLSLVGVYLLEYGGREVSRTVLRPLGHGVRLPHSLGAGPTAAVGAVRALVRDEPGSTRLDFSCDTPHGRLHADLTVDLPQDHETMSVVIPWSERRFQYTSKHTARPARGTVRLGADVLDFSGGWGVLDHGRGRWPYNTTWNWGAAAGETDGHVVGLQFGGKWTQGTGLTENALCVDGRLHKIGEELEWVYDRSDPLTPWWVRTPGSDQVDLVFTPFHERVDRTDTGVIVNDTSQCFGHYTGTVRTDTGEQITVDGLTGFAEHVRMRW
ncbi:DUF2804 domain-containing protein [Nocardiopsis algeriensis]|uniref:DUF2804 domain-containing protein n=1 Tax=Nocardiopsis algeriensis TaxID=1478215 RepID=A0A841IP66_9ACTN|nr:DUF2804 domain-containing protein [Nocardiopsis algeriensis]MBB6119980.1 hypothetical protein [Nocardiopsis algeriensis]